MRTLDIEYDFVAVIDGLPAVDRSGYRLSDDLMRDLAAAGISQERAFCQSRKGLVGALDHFTSRASRDEAFALHFICHGNASGIGIGDSKEVVRWEELTPLLQELNKKMGGALVVNLTSCFGLHGFKIVDPFSRDLPFFGVIGPFEKIGMERAREVNSIFYARILEGRDLAAAVNEVNRTLGEATIFLQASENYQFSFRRIAERKLEESLPPASSPDQH